MEKMVAAKANFDMKAFGMTAKTFNQIHLLINQSKLSV